MSATSTHEAATSGYPLGIPERVFQMAVESKQFFQRINAQSGSPEMDARDIFDTARPLKHAAILKRFAPLEGAKVLEIGSGFGVNLAVWIKAFGVDGYGIEPSGIGFGSSLEASQILLEANGIARDRAVNAVGEEVPFEDNSFDIVYSASALEHVKDPQRVLEEAVRVLRPGGLLHFEIPNYYSYFETHYMIPQPPIPSTAILALWVRLWDRDPAFARTVRTINPIWCRRAVSKIRKKHRVTLVTLGQDLFLEHFARPWKFELEHLQGKLSSVIRAAQAVNWGNWIGRLIVACQGFYPIYLTLRKERSASG